MRVRQIKLNWEAFARRDAFSAILTQPAATGRWTAEEFFRTGLEEVERMRHQASEAGLDFGGRQALDFGCGIGRISRHLLDHFEQIDGVDISGSMLEQARQHNPSKRIRFIEHAGTQLAFAPDDAYDLALSYLTLQHVPPDCTRQIIAELIRVVRPGGTVFFQLPVASHASSARLLQTSSVKARLRRLLPVALLERYRMFRNKQPRMDMFGLPRDEVEVLVEAAGGELVRAIDSDDTQGLLSSLRYLVRPR